MRLFNPSTLLLLVVVSSLAQADNTRTQESVRIVPTDEVKWGYLNPLRGELSPGAADLWGNRVADTATGMLVRFNKGFESPPHIHNISYRGIVIKGLMHNDDPGAAKMWMPAGSFWTQPAGEDHTTAANGGSNLIYLEIDSGPYLVQPSQQQFDNGERPLNLHADNIVWLPGSEIQWLDAEAVDAAPLWQSDAGLHGTMVKFPAGFDGTINTRDGEFRAVVIAGEINYQRQKTNKADVLAAGSYLESSAPMHHRISNSTDSPATVYLRANQPYSITLAE